MTFSTFQFVEKTVQNTIRLRQGGRALGAAARLE